MDKNKNINTERFLLGLGIVFLVFGAVLWFIFRQICCHPDTLLGWSVVLLILSGVGLVFVFGLSLLFARN